MEIRRRNVSFNDVVNRELAAPLVDLVHVDAVCSPFDWAFSFSP